MKLKKKKRAGKFRGSRTQGYSGKKKKGSGNKGGKGFGGSGKKSGHKASFVNKYFFPYFGKQGFTSRTTAKKENIAVNVGELNKNIDNLIESGKAKKTARGYEISLPSHKILGDGEVTENLIITALSFSQSAKEKIEKAGGEARLVKQKSEEKPLQKEEKLEKPITQKLMKKKQ